MESKQASKLVVEVVQARQSCTIRNASIPAFFPGVELEAVFIACCRHVGNAIGSAEEWSCALVTLLVQE